MEALKDATGKLTLWGNYGADYHLTLTLTNPTAQPPKPSPSSSPRKPARRPACSGLTAGRSRKSIPTPPPQEPQIAKYTLEPGETRTVQVETIPLNGSSYPASIIVHAL